MFKRTVGSGQGRSTPLKCGKNSLAAHYTHFNELAIEDLDLQTSPWVGQIFPADICGEYCYLSLWDLFGLDQTQGKMENLNHLILNQWATLALEEPNLPRAIVAWSSLSSMYIPFSSCHLHHLSLLSPSPPVDIGEVHITEVETHYRGHASSRISPCKSYCKSSWFVYFQALVGGAVKIAKCCFFDS